MKRTKENSTEYSWGKKCKGWHLAQTESLGVIQEIMPPKTEEVKHKHNLAQQFFFILKGEATFEIEGKEFIIHPSEGIHIKKGKTHKIINNSKIDLEFLVISEPHSHGDKIIIE
ncbi:MAG: cupin domain-containing protein [Melioribacteraceae bacterium]